MSSALQDPGYVFTGLSITQIDVAPPVLANSNLGLVVFFFVTGCLRTADYYNSLSYPETFSGIHKSDLFTTCAAKAQLALWVSAPFLDGPASAAQLNANGISGAYNNFLDCSAVNDTAFKCVSFDWYASGPYSTASGWRSANDGFNALDGTPTIVMSDIVVRADAVEGYQPFTVTIGGIMVYDSVFVSTTETVQVYVNKYQCPLCSAVCTSVGACVCPEPGLDPQRSCDAPSQCSPQSQPPFCAGLGYDISTQFAGSRVAVDTAARNLYSVLANITCPGALPYAKTLACALSAPRCPFAGAGSMPQMLCRSACYRLTELIFGPGGRAPVSPDLAALDCSVLSDEVDLGDCFDVFLFLGNVTGGTACPLNCPNQCSTHGTCDFTTGRCTCRAPWSGAACSLTLSPLANLEVGANVSGTMPVAVLGSFSWIQPSSLSHPYLAVYDASTGAYYGLPDTDFPQTIDRVFVNDSTVVVSGPMWRAFKHIEDVFPQNTFLKICRGGAWSTIDFITDGRGIRGMVFVGDQIYVWGDFMAINHNYKMRQVAVLDTRSNTWSPWDDIKHLEGGYLSAGLQVNGIVRYKDLLVVGGNYQVRLNHKYRTPNGPTAFNFAAYNLTTRTWQCLGWESQLGWISALTLNGSVVYFAGPFLSVPGFELGTGGFAAYDLATGQYMPVGMPVSERSRLEEVIVTGPRMFALDSYLISPLPRLAFWENGLWNSVPAEAMIIGSIYDIERVNDGLIAIVGAFTVLNMTDINIVGLNTSTLELVPLGSRLSGGAVSAMVQSPSDPNLYFISGSFTSSALSLPISELSMFDGYQWSPLPLPITAVRIQGKFAAFASTGDTLFAGGEFAGLTGCPACVNLAMWRPATGWTALPSSINASATGVADLVVDRGVLYVAGSFRAFGGGRGQSTLVLAVNLTTFTALNFTVRTSFTASVRHLAVLGDLLFIGAVANLGSTVVAFNVTTGRQTNSPPPFATQGKIQDLVSDRANNAMYAVYNDKQTVVTSAYTEASPVYVWKPGYTQWVPVPGLEEWTDTEDNVAIMHTMMEDFAYQVTPGVTPGHVFVSTPFLHLDQNLRGFTSMWEMNASSGAGTVLGEPFQPGDMITAMLSTSNALYVAYREHNLDPQESVAGMPLPFEPVTFVNHALTTAGSTGRLSGVGVGGATELANVSKSATSGGASPAPATVADASDLAAEPANNVVLIDGGTGGRVARQTTGITLSGTSGSPSANPYASSESGGIFSGVPDDFARRFDPYRKDRFVLTRWDPAAKIWHELLRADGPIDQIIPLPTDDRVLVPANCVIVDSLEYIAGVGSVLGVQLRDSFNRDFTGSATVAYCIAGTCRSASNSKTAGLYPILVNGTTAGVVNLAVTVNGVAIRGSPFSVRCWPAAASAARSVLGVPADGLRLRVGANIVLPIVARDAFDNLMVSGGAGFVGAVGGALPADVSIQDNGDGTYSFMLFARAIGAYPITVSLNGATIAAGQRTLVIGAGSLAPAACNVSGRPLTYLVAGVPSVLTVSLSDGYGNVPYGSVVPVVQVLHDGVDVTAASQACAVTGPGSFSCSFTATRGGPTGNALNVFVGGVLIAASPYAPYIAPSNTTSPDTTLAFFSPSISNGSITASETIFRLGLQARDTYCFPLYNAGDVFQVSLRLAGGSSSTFLLTHDANTGLGLYNGTFALTKAGVYSLVIALLPVNQPVADSPYVFTVVAAPTVSLSMTTLLNHPEGLIAGATASALTIQPRDAFGNLQLTIPLTVAATTTATGATDRTLVTAASLTGYEVYLGATVARAESVVVTINGVAVPGMPVVLNVVPATTSATTSQVFGAGLTTGIARQDVVFYLTAYDAYNNPRGVGGDILTVALNSGSGQTLQASIVDYRNGTYQISYYLDGDGGSVIFSISINGVPMPNTNTATIEAVCDLGYLRQTLIGPCVKCPAASFSDTTSAAACTPCPVNSNTDSAALATSVDACACNVNYFRSPASTCDPCPAGGSCSGGSAAPVARPGFFRSPGTGNGAAAFVACEPFEACLGGADSQCATGYQGFKCGTCADGFYLAAGTCVECGSSAAVLIALAIPILLVILAILIRFNYGSRMRSPYTVLAIGFNSIQITALYADFNLNWPRVATSVFHALSIANFNLEIAAPECSIKTANSYVLKFAAILLLPVALALCFAIEYLFMHLYYVLVKRYGARLKARFPARLDPAQQQGTVRLWFAQFMTEVESTPRFMRHTCIRAYFQLLVLIYLPLASMGAGYFACTSANGTSTMIVSPSTICYDDAYNRLIAPAVIGIALYLIGIPVYVGFVLRYKKRTMTPEKFENRYSFLVSKFKPEFYAWEIPVMLRKIGVALCTTFLRDTKSYQALGAILVLLVAQVFQQYKSPYRKPSHNSLETITVASAIGVLFLGIFFQQVDRPTLANVLIVALVVGSLAYLLFAFVMEVRVYLRERAAERTRRSRNLTDAEALAAIEMDHVEPNAADTSSNTPAESKV